MFAALAGRPVRTRATATRRRQPAVHGRDHGRRNARRRLAPGRRPGHRFRRVRCSPLVSCRSSPPHPSAVSPRPESGKSRRRQPVIHRPRQLRLLPTLCRMSRARWEPHRVDDTAGAGPFSGRHSSGSTKRRATSMPPPAAAGCVLPPLRRSRLLPGLRWIIPSKARPRCLDHRRGCRRCTSRRPTSSHGRTPPRSVTYEPPPRRHDHAVAGVSELISLI